jgi:hypothetical protein
VCKTDDIIYVEDAGALSEPGLVAYYNNSIVYDTDDAVIYNGLLYRALSSTVGNLPTNATYWTLSSGAANVWGMITINGERIMYRYRDTANNTVSGLLRGTAGTATDEHAVGSFVYDIGRGNLLPARYQDYYDSSCFVGDGSTTAFVSDTISYASTEVTLPNSTIVNATQVFIGGTLQTSGYVLSEDGYDLVPYDMGLYSSSNLAVTFDVAPPAGVEVCLRVRRGLDWYNTATPLLTLGQTDTPAARFLRDE